MIIGLSDVRKYDLTTVFKHMYTYATEDKTKRKSNDQSTDTILNQCIVHETSETPVSPECRSPTRPGEGARDLARAEDIQHDAKLQDPRLLLTGVKPPRRAIMPPRLQNELIKRSGTRTNPSRRSARLSKDVVSNPKGELTDIYSPTTAGLTLNPGTTSWNC